jgi:hypothetical protein
MKTAYRPATISPYQINGNGSIDIHDQRHPINIELQKSLQTITFTATFEENTEELEMLKNIPGVISIKCLLKMGDQIIATGSGTAIFTKINKYIERTVRSAVNSSLIAAIYQGVKVLDALHFDDNFSHSAARSIVETPKEQPASQGGITDKQKKYLRELVSANIHNELECDRWESEIDNLSRNEASQAIQSFKK